MALPVRFGRRLRRLMDMTPAQVLSLGDHSASGRGLRPPQVAVAEIQKMRRYKKSLLRIG